jgi:4-amino-4-deoxy-L-arabinose transferase-like glycosyltransferase
MRVPIISTVSESRHQWSHMRWLGVLVALNLVIRGLWLYFVHPPQLYDFQWYYTHAVQFFKGEGYVWNGHYTAYWPMGYPFFLATLFRLIGPSVGVGLVANALLSTGIAVLVYALTYTVAESRRIALTAAVGYTVLPSHIEWNAVLGSEELYTFLLMLSLWLFTLHARGKGLRMSAVAGFVLGIACMVRPVALLFPIAVLVYERWVARESWRRTALVTTVFTAALLLGIMPLTLRNWFVMHHFILVSTNGGVDLWQGTKADGVYFWSWDPKVNPLLPYQHDDYLQNKVGMHVALMHIVQHPLSTIAHGFAKWFFLYWLDTNVVSVTFAQLRPAWSAGQLLAVEVGNTLVYYVWMVLAVVGLWAVVRRKVGVQPEWRIPVLYVAYNTAIFFFFPAWDRFRFPIMPCLAVLFGVGCTVMWQRFKSAKMHTKSDKWTIFS